MSHFAVAVIVDNDSIEAFGEYDSVARLLAPYDENANEDSGYAEFIDCTEEVVCCAADSGDSEESYAEMNGYICRDGEWGFWGNKNAKWDWWTLGGRFDMNVEYGIDVADWDPLSIDDDDYRHARESYERGLENDFAGWFMSPKYLKERYNSDPDLYAKEHAINMPYAVVSPYGDWISPGEVGWFGCSNETADTQSDYESEVRNLLDSIGKERGKYEVFIVDCHI